MASFLKQLSPAAAADVRMLPCGSEEACADSVVLRALFEAQRDVDSRLRKRFSKEAKARAQASKSQALREAMRLLDGGVAAAEIKNTSLLDWAIRQEQAELVRTVSNMAWRKDLAKQAIKASKGDGVPAMADGMLKRALKDNAYIGSIPHALSALELEGWQDQVEAALERAKAAPPLSTYVAAVQIDSFNKGMMRVPLYARARERVRPGGQATYGDAMGILEQALKQLYKVNNVSLRVDLSQPPERKGVEVEARTPERRVRVLISGNDEEVGDWTPLPDTLSAEVVEVDGANSKQVEALFGEAQGEQPSGTLLGHVFDGLVGLVPHMVAAVAPQAPPEPIQPPAPITPKQKLRDKLEQEYNARCNVVDLRPLMKKVKTPLQKFDSPLGCKLVEQLPPHHERRGRRRQEPRRAVFVWSVTAKNKTGALKQARALRNQFRKVAPGRQESLVGWDVVVGWGSGKHATLKWGEA